MTMTAAVVEPSSISRVDIEVEIPLGEIRLRFYRPHIPSSSSSSSSLSSSSATVEMDADETASLILSALDRALADEFETTGGDDKDGGAGGSGPASHASYVGVRIESLRPATGEGRARDDVFLLSAAAASEAASVPPCPCAIISPVAG